MALPQIAGAGVPASRFRRWPPLAGGHGGSATCLHQPASSELEASRGLANSKREGRLGDRDGRKYVIIQDMCTPPPQSYI